MLADLLFLLFGGTLLLAGLGVITARNPMYCVLFMVLAFVNATALFVLLGAEFLGLLLLMVYVGAIAVMFLFVIMTIDIDFAVLKEGFATYLPIGALLAALLLIELIAAIKGGLFSGVAATPPEISDKPDIIRIGEVLFTDYALPFQLIGLILLVAMVGSIVLTHRRRPEVKRQDVAAQIARKKEDSMTMTSPKAGAGVRKTLFNPKNVEK